MSKSQWRFLILKAESPFDSKIYYFIDKCLPFGSSISCAHFQEFSNAVAHIVRFKTKRDLVNYLDDYLFVELLKAICDGQMDVFMKVCNQINFPVSIEKTFRGTTLLVFLGLLINTVEQIVSIPVEKIEKADKLISEILRKKKMTLKQLQKVCGFLNFLGRCVVPGCAFTQQLYMLTRGQNNLKPHHHIRISSECRKDLDMWLTFIRHPSVYCHKFMDFSADLSAEEKVFYTDASKNESLGFGGICNKSWMYAQWEQGFIKKWDPSIEYLELFGVLAGALLWIDRFRNRRVIIFRWFKFTLKPPYSIAHDNLRLAIWDTSFWTFWLKFGHKGP